MKLIFAGTPEFAAVALEALIEAGHEIAFVLTQPDRPAGRGLKLKPSAVKTAALLHGLRVEQPLSLKNEAAQTLIKEANADAMIVAAYGLILPREVLNAPRLGCFNIHASLLPRWRGAAPIQRAMLENDAKTGITIMQMDEGLDTGAMLLTGETAILDTDTAGDLHDRLAKMGAALMLETLEKITVLTARKQDETAANYANKLDKAEARIDFAQAAQAVARKIRAFNPVPGAFCSLNGELCKIWFAQAVDFERKNEKIGEVIRADSVLWIVCGEGAISVSEIQMAGAKRMNIEQFLRGKTLLGQVFESGA